MIETESTRAHLVKLNFLLLLVVIATYSAYNKDLIDRSRRFNTNRYDSRPSLTVYNDLCPVPVPKMNQPLPKNPLAGFITLPENGITICTIAKSCRTKTWEILSILGGWANGTNRDPKREWEVYGPEARKYRPVAKGFELEDANYTHYVVVRDPVQKFLSGFIEKCVQQPQIWACDGYGTNVTGFILNLYKTFQLQANNPNNIGRSLALVVSMVATLTHNTGIVGRRLYATFLNCDPSITDGNGFTYELMNIFRWSGVSESKLSTVNQYLAEKIHPTSQLDKELLLKPVAQDWRLLDCLLKIYDADYHLLNMFDHKWRNYQRLISHRIRLQRFVPFTVV